MSQDHTRLPPTRGEGEGQTEAAAPLPKAAIEALAPEECICFGPDGDGCVCLDAERALRAIARGDYELSDQAREWCLQEIDGIEGYDRQQYEGDADRHVASGVLNAWADYCRDKGLL